MVAFGVGELTGILGGLSVGATWITTLKVVFGLITAAVLLYGVWYWNDRFADKNLIRSFADFFKVAVWFIYTMGVGYLFFSTVDLNVDFYPAFINKDMFTRGIQVSVPGGSTSIINADKPYLSLTAHKVPKVYSFLEFPDALETMLITKLTLSADKTGWDGYFANNVDPTRYFEKCAFNALSQVSSDDAVTWVCSYGTKFGLYDFLRNATPIGLMRMLLEGTGVVGTSGICSGIRTANPNTVRDKINSNISVCLSKEMDKLNDYFYNKINELDKLHSEGKIPDSVYDEKRSSLLALKRKWVDVFNNIVTNQSNFDVFATAYSRMLIQEANKAPLPSHTVETSDTTGFFKTIVEWFGKSTTEAFVGEYLLLDLFEAFQKFMLIVEMGFVLPFLFILSMLPEYNSPTGSKIGFALKAIGIYFLIKLARVFVFLVYLIAHNYFAANVLGA